jgi:MFS family permease
MLRHAASPVAFLMTVHFVNALGFASWTALFNNFAKEAAGFSWFEIGLAQTVREIPGLLAFTAIFWTRLFREQTFAYISLAILSIGIAATGFFPSTAGILLTTTVMSVGFHYLETMNQSLSLQLLPKADAARSLGMIAGAGAAAQFIAFGGLAAAWHFGWQDYIQVFLCIGALALLLTLAARGYFKKFDGPVPQLKTIVLKRRYSLYYALTLMSGARRQIFTAFAAFLLVKLFGYTVTEVAVLMLLTAALNTVAAPYLGALVGRIGERPTIFFENIVLIIVFAGYAVAANNGFGSWGSVVAGLLYVVDGLFFTLVIAQRTYFQKIGDEEDMAPTAAISFTINHIMAVIIPVTFGLLGMANPGLIFWLGVVIAVLSLLLAFLVPHDPGPGREVHSFGGRKLQPAE